MQQFRETRISSQKTRKRSSPFFPPKPALRPSLPIKLHCQVAQALLNSERKRFFWSEDLGKRPLETGACWGNLREESWCERRPTKVPPYLWATHACTDPKEHSKDRQLTYNINHCSNPRLASEQCMQRINPKNIAKTLKTELTVVLPCLEGNI